MLTEEQQILRVYELEPREKHPTIFRWFDDLPPAGSFTIENDHDPIPLYYELRAEREGELEAFDYLESGPEIWRIRITKAQPKGTVFSACTVPVKEKKSPQQFSSCSVDTSRRDKKVGELLDVTKLEPSLKHPTIFDWFHALKPGESFTIRNDHDPKPLYYQMIGQLGPVFTWNYIEQGPDWWQVVIQKNKADEPTIGQIAAKDIRKAETLKRLGVDFCCGGKKTVSQAAAEVGITAAELEKALNDASGNSAGVNLAFNRWDADFLADYIYNQHHKYYYENREFILMLAAKVKQVHGQSHPELLLLAKYVEELFIELDIHFKKEEQFLFPYVKTMAAIQREGTRLLNPVNVSDGSLNEMFNEHETAGDMLKTIRTITDNYQVPAGACNSYKMLFSKLEELESDLHQHIHLENNILFPKIVQMEKEIN